MQDVEKRVIGKVMWRLIPFLIVCYFVAYLDRVNVGFAKLHMNQALGLSEAAFGLGAGLFFVGYFLFEVPSNIFLERVGARVWIARIMITWGIVSAAFAFIPSISAATGIPTTGVFYSLRLLLGACEAGFFPGIIFYLTLWFPAVYRARVISLFMLAIPISSIIGSPISGLLLGVTGWGLEGWQWLFILEALPSVVVGICVLLYLTDFPRQARWLQQDEIAWLEDVQATEKRNKEKVEHLSLGQALTDYRILLCALVYFCLNAASYGVAFFLPTIIKGFGVSDTQTGLLAALPFIFGAAGMVLLGRHSDRTMERKGHVAAALLMAAVGIGVAGLVSQLRPCHGIALLRTDRRLRGPPDVLAAAGELSNGSIGCRRHRRDQLAWKSFRFRRSLRNGLSEGFNRQFYRRSSVAGGLRAGGRSRCRAATHRCKARASVRRNRDGALDAGDHRYLK
ncbi:ACS family tartrate transporter-like MFS transporter [Bradyrhizobium sp. i1.4.4]